MPWLVLVLALPIILAGAELFTNGVEWVGVGFGLSEGAVGGVLARAGGQMPAHRIVNASGRLAPGWEREQAELLRSEGVRVRGGAVASPMPWWDGPPSRS